MKSQRMPKPCSKIVAKFLEQMNMLCFLTGQLQQCANLVIVAQQLRPCVVECVGQNKFLHQTEHGEIFMATNLVQNPFLFGG